MCQGRNIYLMGNQYCWPVKALSGNPISQAFCLAIAAFIVSEEGVKLRQLLDMPQLAGDPLFPDNGTTGWRRLLPDICRLPENDYRRPSPDGDHPRRHSLCLHLSMVNACGSPVPGAIAWRISTTTLPGGCLPEAGLIFSSIPFGWIKVRPADEKKVIRTAMRTC